MNDILIVVCVVIVGALCGTAGWLIGQKLSAARVELLEAKLTDAQATASALAPELTQARLDREKAIEAKLVAEGDAKTIQAKLDEKEISLKERLDDLKAAEQQLSDRFAALSSKALADSTEELLKRAKDVLGEYKDTATTETEKTKSAIEQLLEPVTKQLGELDELHQDIERRRTLEVGQLSQQIDMLTKSGEELRRETLGLAKKMHNPGQAGSWGEMVLEKIIEVSGLTEGITYTTQETIKDANTGKLGRPDVSIKMPGNKVVHIDSKAPFGHYLDAIDLEDDVLRKQGLANFAQKVSDHVKVLRGRNYDDAEESIDFTILFLPSEGAYRAAVESKPQIIQESLENKVVIATPTTLFAILKTVHYAWRSESLTKDAAQVRKAGADLYASLSTLTDHYVRLGKNLNQAVDSFNKFGGSLESNTLSKARKLHQLKVKDAEELPELEPIHTTTHVLSRPELTASSRKVEPQQLALASSNGEEE